VLGLIAVSLLCGATVAAVDLAQLQHTLQDANGRGCNSRTTQATAFSDDSG
jgi:hypothetical protein